MELQGAGGGCVGHFFYSYDNIQDKSSPKKVYMGSQFEVTVPHGKQGEVAGPAAPEVRKQEKDAGTQLTFFFLSIWDPSRPYLRWVSPPQLP